MAVHYLEIVSNDIDSLTALHSACTAREHDHPAAFITCPRIARAGGPVAGSAAEHQSRSNAAWIASVSAVS
jgi:hypothetical protein